MFAATASPRLLEREALLDRLRARLDHARAAGVVWSSRRRGGCVGASSASAASREALVAQERRALTTREVEVLRLLAEGLQNGSIAGRLYVSRPTIDHHVSAILRKVAVKTRGAAVAEAGRLALLSRRAA